MKIIPSIEVRIDWNVRTSITTRNPIPEYAKIGIMVGCDEINCANNIYFLLLYPHTDRHILCVENLSAKIVRKTPSLEFAMMNNVKTEAFRELLSNQ